ncbi:hypothetical protein ACJX0J_013689, partial [Zea mays]
PESGVHVFLGLLADLRATQQHPCEFFTSKYLEREIQTFYSTLIKLFSLGILLSLFFIIYFFQEPASAWMERCYITLRIFKDWINKFLVKLIKVKPPTLDANVFYHITHVQPILQANHNIR